MTPNTESNVVVIRKSALSTRWDAKYHILLRKYRKQVDLLLKDRTANELLSLLSDAPHDREVLSICFNNRGKSWDDAYAPRRTNEEIALAIAASVGKNPSKFLNEADKLTKEATHLRNRADKFQRLGIFDC